MERAGLPKMMGKYPESHIIELIHSDAGR